MSRKKQHNWATFYSPRNGRISIQACSQCGVAKSFVVQGSQCQEISEQKKVTRLRGWSMTSRSEAAHALSIS